MATIKKYNGSSWENAVVRKFGTATEAVENPLYSDGTAITAYTLKGNEEHTGTPSPSNPITINGVGNKTANLFDEAYTGLTTSLTYFPIYVGDGTFTLSTTTPMNPNEAASLFFLAGNVSTGASTQYNGVWDRTSRTVTSSSGYVTIAYRYNEGVYVNPKLYNTMLNTGSTAKPYEPWGFKIPISNGQTTTPIYLTEQLMKINDAVDSLVSDRTVSYDIRKYVLTGDENIEVLSSGQAPIRISGLYFRRPAYTDCTWLCTHYPCVPNSASWGSYDYCLTVSTQDSDSQMRIRDINYNSGTASDFKAYLAAQYAAGTPVTIWVVLSTRTEQVTAPSIPTTEGANSITVDTTVQPSEFTATWSGWHNAYVKEKSENLIDSSYIFNASINALIPERYSFPYTEGGNRYTAFFAVQPNTTYTFSATGNDRLYIFGLEQAYTAEELAAFDTDELVSTDLYCGYNTDAPHSYTFTTSSTARMIGVYYSLNVVATDVMANQGSTALPYAPYWE